jgi:hypothetical protein
MSIIQTARTAETLISGSNTVSMAWPTAFPDNTYFVAIQNPELILTNPSTGLSPATITSWTYSGTGVGISIVINNPNGSSISSQIDAIGIVAGTQDNFMNFINRLTALDGVGAVVPSSAAVPVLQADMNGLRSTLNQLVLTLQSQLNAYGQQVSQLQSSVNTLLGNVS